MIINIKSAIHRFYVEGAFGLFELFWLQSDKKQGNLEKELQELV